jgi:hypothetical protein
MPMALPAQPGGVPWARACPAPKIIETSAINKAAKGKDLKWNCAVEVNDCSRGFAFAVANVVFMRFFF